MADRFLKKRFFLWRKKKLDKYFEFEDGIPSNTAKKELSCTA